MRPRIVAVAGGTTSGKSTLAAMLVRFAGIDKAVCLPFDSYYHCLGHLPPEERGRKNVDHPDALDPSLYSTHIAMLIRGDTIAVPVYDFKTHTRAASVEKIHARPFVIAEGILVLHYPEVRALCDYSIFLDVPEHERLARRISRDVSERGRTESTVIDQWCSHVQPMHKAFCEPTKGYASEILTGSPAESDIAELWARLESGCRH